MWNIVPWGWLRRVKKTLVNLPPNKPFFFAYKQFKLGLCGAILILQLFPLFVCIFMYDFFLILQYFVTKKHLNAAISGWTFSVTGDFLFQTVHTGRGSVHRSSCLSCETSCPLHIPQLLTWLSHRLGAKGFSNYCRCYTTRFSWWIGCQIGSSVFWPIDHLCFT